MPSIEGEMKKRARIEEIENKLRELKQRIDMASATENSMGGGGIDEKSDAARRKKNLGNEEMVLVRELHELKEEDQ